MANNRLTRDKEHAMLGGVCAGIANRFSLDPTIVRVATIALGVVTAAVPVALIYLALWIIMPASEAPPHRPSRDEITEEIRSAADRVQEAARIVTAAAKQAADDISHLQDRRHGGAPGNGATTAHQEESASGDTPSMASSPPAPPPPMSLTDEQRRQQEQEQQ